MPVNERLLYVEYLKSWMAHECYSSFQSIVIQLKAAKHVYRLMLIHMLCRHLLLLKLMMF